MKVAINARMLIRGKLEGLGWYTHEVSRRLVDRHPEWTVYLLFDRPFSRDFVFGPSVRPLLIPPPARHPWLWHIWFEYALPLAFRRLRPDIFFSPDGYLSVRARVPTAMVLHDLAYLHYPEHLPERVRRYYRRHVPRFVGRADALLTVSDYSRRDIAAHFGLSPDGIRITGNGVRPGFRPLSAPEKQAARRRYAQGKPYFLYLGAIRPRKNVARLIRAYDQYRQANPSEEKLVLAGATGWKSEPVQRALRNARHRADILLPGYMEEAEVPLLLGGATALCYVSLFEGFGLPLLEAMEAEVPILTSTTSSLPEVAGPAGLCVDPADSQAIARGLQRLSREPGLRESLIAAGRRRRQAFSWERATDVVEEAILALARRD